MKDKQSGAEYRAAKRAEYRQSMARMGQGATAAVKSILQLMYHGKTPLIRLRCVRDIHRVAQESIEIEDFVAAVEDAERLAHAAQEGSVALSKRRRPRIAGHGAKLPRRREQAIAALLAQRSVAEAARTIGIGAQTLRWWMQDRDFNADYAAAACAVFGPAMRLAQQRAGDASSIARNLAVDLNIPEQTRRQAALYVNSVLMASVKDDLAARLSAMEPSDASGSEPHGA